MHLLREENTLLTATIGLIIGTLLATLVISTTFVNTTTLPPVGAFYNANDLEWVSVVRALSAVIVGTCMYAMMWTTASDFPRHRNSAVRIRTLAQAILFAVAGSWAYTNLGMVVWGGAWHVIGLGFSALTSVSALYTCWVFMRTRKDILAIEEPQ